MTLHIIVDGYNLIRQTPRLAEMDRRNLESGREALIRLLSGYRHARPHRITVVFDGADGPDFPGSRQTRMGIHILFSSAGENADMVIKRLAARDREKALVVTSDRDVISGAEACRAATINSQSFGEKLTFLSNIDGFPGPSEEEFSGWRPTTKKKGPSRRAPKRVRKNLQKISKL